MRKEEILDSYEELSKILSLDERGLGLLQKIGINLRSHSLKTFRGPKVHASFKDWLILDDTVISYIKKLIDDNVVISNITDTQITVDYVFRDETIVIDISKIM